MIDLTARDLTVTQQRELLADFADHETFCRESLRIPDLGGQVVPFDLWPSQRKLARKIRAIRRGGRPVRLVILKTRRSGFTMGSVSEMFREIAFFPGRKGLVIADNYDPAGDEAFDYLKQYQKYYRPFERHGVGIGLQPAQIKESQPKRIQWGEGSVEDGDELSLASRISVLSAEAGDVGRGGGRHFVLGDEVAFWRDARTTLLAVLNMVPKLPSTTVILQSTANGVGGDFYELCQQAMDPANTSGWEFLFFGWLEHPIYCAPVADPVKFQGSLDAEELHLHQQMGATLEQLAWRRLTIATECRGSIDLFHQEYPTTPEEAFISSGRPRLDQQALARHPVRDGQPGELQLVEQGPQRKLLFMPRQHGALTIWERPQAGHRYVIGADPSKGKDVSAGKRGDNPDYSAAFVADAASGLQVALLRERIRPVAFGDYVALLGRYYNWAFLCPEVNDPGFLEAILRAGYPAELIYQRQRDPTDRRPGMIEELGFETTAQNREWLINAADDAIRTMSITIQSHVVVRECQTFVIKPTTGKAEHMDGEHDDTVIALGLAEMARRTIPRRLLLPEQAGAGAKVGYYGAAKRRRDDDD